MGLRPENVLLQLAVLWVMLTCAYSHPQTVFSYPQCPQPGQEREGGMCERRTAPGRLCMDMPPADHCPARVDWLHQGSVCFHRDLAFNCSMGKWTRADEGLLQQKHREKRFVEWIALGVFAAVGACLIFCNQENYEQPQSDQPPNKPPSIKCPEDISDIAPAGHSQVAVKWETPKASDPDGGSPSIKKTNGPEPGSMFSEGTTYIAYEARDSGGLTDSCFFNINVKVVRCPFARAPRNGQRPKCSGAREENQFGARCRFSCNEGHELQGQDTLTCYQRGKWSHPSPTCAPKSCGPPRAVSGGSLLCSDGHSYKSICSLVCDAGYSHTGPAFTSCTASGEWTSLKPCKDTEDPTFPQGCPLDQQVFSGPLRSPVSVTWTDPDTDDNSKKDVTLTSRPESGSSFAVGFHRVRVTATDEDGNSRSCSFFVNVQERECPSLYLENGRMTCNYGNVEGSTCTASCTKGYEVKGQASVTCQSDSTWSAATPLCQKVTCPAALPEVKSGNMLCHGSQEYQDMCSLSCKNHGYRIEPPNYITCRTDGTWSPAGSCRDVAPPVLKCPDHMELFAAPLGQKTSVTWDPPTVSDNSGENLIATSDVTPGSDFKVGVTYVTYTARDSSGNEGKCRFSVNVKTESCDPPDLEDPARKRSLMVYQCPEGYVHGARCTLNCTYGFPLLGAEDITCVRDDSQNPPVLSWEVNGTQPSCFESECPELLPPENGALSCMLANYGQDCLMSCRAGYDVKFAFDGHFMCTNSERVWRPYNTTPTCLRVRRPQKARLQSELLYFTDSCERSIQQIKENFIQALQNSKYKDACVNVPSCNVDNVLVTCGPTLRRRRSARSEGSERSEVNQGRHRRGAFSSRSMELVIQFDIVVPFVQNGTEEETFATYKSLENTIYTVLRDEGRKGAFDLGSLTPDLTYLYPPTLNFDGCPNGTRYHQRFSSTKASCVGCSQGNYLDGTECVPCPKGQYTELDNATSCTDCPQGFSTLTTASESQEDCKKLCTPGHFSPTGFEPCQPCPSGSYQSRGQSVTCDLCPTGTWTEYSASKSRHDCVAADVKLTANSSLTSSMTLQQWPVRVMTWLKLQTNTVVFADLQLPLSISRRLTIISQGADRAVASGRFLSLAVDQWTRVMAYISIGNGGLTLSLQNDNRLIFTLPVVPLPLPFNTTLTITTLQGGATVAGLWGQSGVTGQQQDDLSTSSCTDQLDNNTLVWNPQPASLSIPSACYAVDRCASSPCGQQGVCENGPSGFQCHCQDGWSGDTCQVPPDACYQHQCQEGAPCVPAGRNYTCQCPEDRSGRLCQFEKVDGEWGEWGQWSLCSSTCEGIHLRLRRCNNPAPTNGGRDCSGQERESESCGESKCEEEEIWSTWSSWSACSATCGGGEKSRTRRCESSVTPQQGGSTCTGPDLEVTSCSTAVCPVHGGWGKWSEWSPCSVTCGGGNQSRERSCDSPVPANGGQDCQGRINQTQACNSAVCPECSQLPEVHGTTFTCNETEAPYQKTCKVRCSLGYHTALPEVYTCGQLTGYRWSFERPNATVEAKHAIHYCTPVKTPIDVSLTNTVPLKGASCDQKYLISQQVNVNLEQLPCIQQDKCTIQVTADCPVVISSSSYKLRKKRSAESVVIKVDFKVNFGQSLELNANDSSSLEQFIEDFKMADQSAALMVLNDTERLFTVTVDDVTITPDVNESSYSIDASCSPGSVSTGDGACVDCPAGFFEEGGRCVPCPLGQYQDRTGSTQCQRCPPHTTWDTPGATHVSQCLYNTTEEQEASDVGTIILGASTGALLGVVVVATITACWLSTRRHKSYPVAAATVPGTLIFDNEAYEPTASCVNPGSDTKPGPTKLYSKLDEPLL